MNDHSSHRRRSSQPAWPTGDDLDSSGPPREHQAEERTGFWSPLWEDDENDAPRRGRRSNGHHNGANGANGSNGRAAHRLPEGRASHRAEPPAPRPAPRHGGAAGSPAWPTEEPPAPPRTGAAPNGHPSAEPRTRVVRPRPSGPPRPGGPRGPVGPGAPGVDLDGPTELLPSAPARPRPEPELLTHREPDYDGDARDEGYADDEYYDDDVPLSDDQKRLRRKKIWRRVRRTGYVLTALMIIVPLIGFFVAYQVVKVPSPQTVAQDQTQVAKLNYSDDSTLGEVVPPGGTNRRMVTFEELPEHVKNAVFAAEDAEFMTNPGFDISGVMRAAWNQVSGGSGGGSTITQQYIKQATGNDEKSVTRKALEVVQAYKMNNTYTKQQILTAYMNTVYFGRGAYGISAAADAYYNKELKDITASEAAQLAGMIQRPSEFDNPEYMQRRWKFVLGQMVDKGWFPAEQAKTEKWPKQQDLEKARPEALTGPAAHIQRAVFNELEREAGITEDEIFQKGLVIKTTINKRAQRIATRSVREVMKGEPKVNLPALVAVDPKNGDVVAYYGGENGVGTDWAAARQEPGSSFKPFDLVALLQKGMGLGEEYDGTSGRTFEGRDAPVRNSGGDSCGENCNVATAMEESINTVFYDIAVNEVGVGAVEKAARAAGITSDLDGDDDVLDGNIAIGGGDTQVSTMEMASAYATFASGGIYNKAHLVAEVRYPDGGRRWAPQASDKLAFDTDQENNQKIARNVTESLVPVLESSDLECADGRECAGKTGTHQFGATEDNAKAWMVGYTPQISAAVSMGAYDTKANKQLPVMNSDDNIVYGSGLPGEIWLKFMDEYLKDSPKESFGEFEAIGKEVVEYTPPPPDTDDERDDEDQPPGQSDKPDKPDKPDGPTTTTEPTLPTETSETDETDPGGPGGPACPPICDEQGDEN